MKKLSDNHQGFSLVGLVLIVTILAMIGWLGWHIKTRPPKKPEPSVAEPTIMYSNTEPIMVLSFDGGRCSTPNNTCQTEYKLLGDGTFQNHTKLSATEVAQLKETINKTDFFKYTENPNPDCPSFRDGSDEILAFPKKYPNKLFRLCTLQIPSDDPAINLINKIIKDHPKDQS